MKRNSIFLVARSMLVAALLVICNSTTHATEIQLIGVNIIKIRAVGDYQGTTFDNTLEIWFSPPATWPSGSNCTQNFRVEIDAKNKHLITAAYLALATGKKVDLNIDDTLPIRSGVCEVSYLDISGQ